MQVFLADTGRHEVLPLSRATCRWKSERQAKKAVQRADCEILVDARIATGIDSSQSLQPRDLEACHWLAKACQRHEVIYLYLSSSRVFSGKADRLYSELDLPDSEDELGLALQQTEQGVSERCERHLLLRLGPIFSHLSGNWLVDALLSIRASAVPLLTDPPRGTPVAAEDASRVISGLLDQLSVGAEPWGVYHYASLDQPGEDEVGEVLLAAASQFFEFDPAAIARHDSVPGPPNAALDCRKIRNTFAIKQLPWRDAMTNTVKHYFKSES